MTMMLLTFQVIIMIIFCFFSMFIDTIDTSNMIFVNFHTRIKSKCVVVVVVVAHVIAMLLFIMLLY